MTPKPRVDVRTARLAEIDELVELQLRSSLVAEQYRQELLEHPDAIEVPRDFVARGYVRVAERDGRILGFASVVPGAGVGELDGLFVEPDQMRQGVGRVLVADAVERARADGMARIEVIANPTALEFYEAVGFVGAGVATTRFGPATRMRLDLTP